MDPNFHSTVLQQPRYFGGEDNSKGDDGDRNEDRGRIRDILNPSRSSTGPGPGTGPADGRSGMSMPGAFGTAPAPPAHGLPPTQLPALHHQQAATSTRSSSFNLRSPTQTPSEYQHPSHHYQQQQAPPPPPLSYASNGNGAGSRSILNPPFIPSNSPSSLPAPSLRPPVGLAPPSSSGLHAPHVERTSPLHAPAVYYSPDTRDRDRERDLDREHGRDQRHQKSGTGSFYDPTTDITTSTSASNKTSSNSTTAKERRVSDTAGSWHNTTNTTSSNHNVSPASPTIRQCPCPGTLFNVPGPLVV